MARWETGPLARTATRLARADAMVLGRRILLSQSALQTLDSGGEEAVRLVAHELAHVEQYRRVGLAGFLLRYAGDYVLSRLRGASHAVAYRSIAFEREAQRLAQIAGAELR